MKVAICDDELNHSMRMEQHLLTITKKYTNIKVEIEVYQSGEELLKILEIEKERPKILFLDIEMGGMDGIQTGKKIREFDRNMIIIYVTSFDKYTMDSFEVSPFRYLLKPVNYEDINQVFSIAVEDILNNLESVFFKSNNKQYQINCEGIIVIISEKGRMLRVVTREEQPENLFYERIKNIEKQLNPLIFIKVNQGTIINLNYVHIISSDEIHLTTGLIIPISRSRRKAVKQAYSLYVQRKVGICQSLK
jgi:DNA-binding LytR/AlgR family response regulator